MKASQARDRIAQLISKFGDCELRLHVKRTKTIVESVPVEGIGYHGQGDFQGLGVITLSGDLFAQREVQ